MAGGPTVAMTGTWLERLTALGVVVLMGALGGILMQILMRGVEFHSGKIGPIKIKPMLTAIQIPPLVGMIIFGCLARNYLCSSYMQHYPEVIAGWTRNVCLSIILLRGGMELDFRGKGLTVVLLTLVPQNLEALGSALATRLIFGMPWTLCLAQGYTLGAVSPAVLVPSMMILHSAGYGTAKGIPTTLIAASSFDDIIAITVFAVFLKISLNTANGGVDEGGSIWVEVGLNVVQILGGFVAGYAFGWSMRIFKRCSGKRIMTKFVLTILVAIATPFVCNLGGFPEAKFVFIIFFGYQCYMQWGEDKPEHELGVFWMFCQPFLFGTVGAAVEFDKITPSVIGFAFAVIIIGVTFRWLGTILAAFEKKYTCKERAFMAFAWIPKATVQAALGAMTLAEAKKRDPALEDYNQWITWGEEMLTTAVFAVCLTAPLGAIMVNTLGTKWLNYDGVKERDEENDKEALTGSELNKVTPHVELSEIGEREKDDTIKPDQIDSTGAKQVDGSAGTEEVKDL